MSRALAGNRHEGVNKPVTPQSWGAQPHGGGTAMAWGAALWLGFGFASGCHWLCLPAL